MPRPNVLALVLAGGQGSRLAPLTDHRAKPAVPYAGVYRLIDISLSNLRNSGISEVGVIVQYQTQSILAELANGRPWDLDRTTGGLRVIPPQQTQGDEGEGEVLAQGNADAIHANLDVIRRADPDVVLVLSSDHVYRLDYWLPIEQHLKNDADATLVTTRVALEDASNYGTCIVDGSGKVTGFAYKPEKPESDVATAEIFVYRPSALIETLERLARESEGRLQDFGHELLPELVEKGTVWAYQHEGYWRDVGRPETYFVSHMDLLAEHPELDLDDPDWPISTLAHQRLPARVDGSATIVDSMISPGCRVSGTVERCVLGPGVVVEAGATVRDAIILEDTVVRTGATVQHAIVDRHVTIGRNAEVGEPFGGEAAGPNDLAMVGQHVAIHGNRRVAAGERVDGVDPLHND